jgi:hypothetical protein
MVSHKGRDSIRGVGGQLSAAQMCVSTQPTVGVATAENHIFFHPRVRAIVAPACDAVPMRSSSSSPLHVAASARIDASLLFVV